MKTLLTLAALSAVASSFAADYTGTGGAIPDTTPAGFSSTVVVPTSTGSISSVTISGLTHTWAGDLIATLTAPNGTTVDLFRRVGSATTTGVGDSSDFGGDYTFKVGGASIYDAAVAATSSAAIPVGTYSPSTNLFTNVAATSYSPTNYSGFSTALGGTWTLNISDNAAGDTGAFTGWTLSTQAVPEPSAFAALGLGAVAMLRRRKRA